MLGSHGLSLCEWHQPGAAMQQVADWLQKLGLGQYAQPFAENDISFSILPDLTDQDLKELGVASLGHRRQLLRAITEMKGGEAVAPKLTNEDIAPVAPHETAERRQVTVMFSDLVGSTALSARMDPEDLREVISAYQKCVAETVQTPMRAYYSFSNKAQSMMRPRIWKALSPIQRRVRTSSCTSPEVVTVTRKPRCSTCSMR